MRSASLQGMEIFIQGTDKVHVRHFNLMNNSSIRRLDRALICPQNSSSNESIGLHCLS